MSKLVTCKDCGTQVSNNATTCPNCGRGRPGGGVPGAVTFVTVAIAVAFVGYVLLVVLPGLR